MAICWIYIDTYIQLSELWQLLESNFNKKIYFQFKFKYIV
jgi:hypothetical protein